ncbi:glycoside hydrolase family 32 protein [uncultured Draconibacterium sp.]|uniref:glycoside hydrolase family 32 protein n=1 Tax=uncultured Draconibacterium sp. TaxID=1573823 RepID=UPI002AA8E061|nr:glycoside hydrolase family 32 protein [uncultured Draconibacterium sp.]
MKSPATILLLILVAFWGCSENKKQEVADSLHFNLKDSILQNPIALIYAEDNYELFYNYMVNGDEKCGLAESKDLQNWSNKLMVFESDENASQNIKTVVTDWNQTTEYSEETTALIAFGVDANQPGTLTILYSNNNGSSWKQDTENTIILADFYEPIQDVKVFWNEETQSWNLSTLSGYEVRFYSSTDLKNWEYLSRFGDDVALKSGQWTSIDLFPMEITETNETKWVLFISADSGSPNEGSGVQYFVGEFDGYVYQASHNKPKWIDHGSDLYQAVVLSDYRMVNKKPVLIGTLYNSIYEKFSIPNNSPTEFSLPRQLTLNEKFYDYYLFSEPVEAIEKAATETISETELTDAKTIEKSLHLPAHIDLTFDVNSRLYLGMAESFGVTITTKEGKELILGYQAERRYFYIADPSIQRDFPDSWDGFYYAPYVTNEPQLDMTLIIDENSAELFAMNGLISVSRKFDFESNSVQLQLFGEQGKVNLQKGSITEF